MAKLREPGLADLTMLDHFWVVLHLMDERARKRNGSGAAMAPRNDALYFKVFTCLIYGGTIKDAAEICGVSYSRAWQVQDRIFRTWQWFGLVMTGPRWEHQYGR